MCSVSAFARPNSPILAALILFLMLSVGPSKIMANPANPFEGDLAEPRRLHDKGVDGDAAAVRKSIELLESWIEVNPHDPSVEIGRAYLGSSYTLLSRDLPIGPGKMDALKHGGVLMDAAVANAPLDMRVRLVRAVNNLQLPSIFGRRNMAYEDFAWLEKQVQTRSGELAKDELQAMHYFVGLSMRYQKRKSHALKIWERGILIDENTSLAGKMRKEASAL